VKAGLQRTISAIQGIVTNIQDNINEEALTQCKADWRVSSTDAHAMVAALLVVAEEDARRDEIRVTLERFDTSKRS
jgi:hypothetical protein